ncbi:hypothetical protein Slin14017_G130640 [Septoria linicola]|nr:hypothetical protein Slin14017_G130640 [Septoria linicola]
MDYQLSLPDARLVEHDMETIASHLNANAVRIEGEDVQRLVVASRAAHAHGLTVFFNPWKMNATADETCAYLTDPSRAAEELRLAGVDLILVITCEYSIFSKGVFPGETFNDRASWMGQQFREAAMSPRVLPETTRNKSVELSKVLPTLSSIAREGFRGPSTYSSRTWESID